MKKKKNLEGEMPGIQGKKTFHLGLSGIYRKIAKKLAEKVLVKTFLTPNQVTLLSGFFGILAAILFSFSEHLYLILGAISLQLNVLIDFADGSLARLRSISSRFGDWLDGVIDHLSDTLVIIGLSYGAYKLTLDPMILFVGLFALGFRLLSAFFPSFSRSSFAGKSTVVINERVQKFGILKYFLFTRTNFYMIITIFCLINKLCILIYVIAIYGVLFYLASLFYLSKKFRKLG